MLPLADTVPLVIQQPPKTATCIASNASGKFVALGNVNGSVVVFEPSMGGAEGGAVPVASFKAHEGPIWAINFSPSEFGSLLATAGTDSTVSIHKEVSPRNWQLIFQESCGQSVVRSIEFVCSPWSVALQQPYQQRAASMYGEVPVGLHLAAGCSDGNITILSLLADHSWVRKSWAAHRGGVNVVRWCPVELTAGVQSRMSGHQSGAMLQDGGTAGGAECSLDPLHKLCSGGVDGLIVVWRYAGAETAAADAGAGRAPAGEWVAEARLPGHHRNVIDLAWTPLNENFEEKLVSLGDDATVILWGLNNATRRWSPLHTVSRVVPDPGRIGWSLDGMFVGLTTEGAASGSASRESGQEAAGAGWSLSPPLKVLTVVGDQLTQLTAAPPAARDKNPGGGAAGDGDAPHPLDAYLGGASSGTPSPPGSQNPHGDPRGPGNQLYDTKQRDMGLEPVRQ